VILNCGICVDYVIKSQMFLDIELLASCRWLRAVLGFVPYRLRVELWLRAVGFVQDWASCRIGLRAGLGFVPCWLRAGLGFVLCWLCTV